MQQQVRPSLRCTLRRTRLICWKTWIRFFKIQVWARTTRGPSPSRSRDQRWAQKASLATHAPPPPAARARERRGSERGKTWGSFSRRGVRNDTFVRTRVRHLLLSLRGASALLFLSNSPVTTVNSTWARLGGNFLLTKLKKLNSAPFWASEFPLILRNEFSALQSSLSVELAVLPSPRGSPMSTPLPSERLSFSAPQNSVIGRSPCWSS